VELGGGEPPEVAQARPDTAAGVAHVRIAAAPGAPGSGDPRMLGVGALGERVAVRGELAQRPGIPAGHEAEPAGDRLRPVLERRGAAAPPPGPPPPPAARSRPAPPR